MLQRRKACTQAGLLRAAAGDVRAGCGEKRQDGGSAAATTKTGCAVPLANRLKGVGH